MINDATIQELEERVAGDPRVRTTIESARQHGIDEIAVVGSYVRNALLRADEDLSGTYLVRKHLQSPMVDGMEIVAEGINGEMAQEIAASLPGACDVLTEHEYLIDSESGTLVLGAARTAIFPADNGVPVHIEASIVEDLGRRDFTINAMAVKVETYGGSATFFDPFGGRTSLESREVKSLSPSAYREDAALVARSAREVQRFGFRASTADSDGITHAITERVSLLAPPRLGAEFGMAWAVLDKFQMSQVLRDLFVNGFLQQVDPAMTKMARLESVLQDIRLPPDLADRHPTSDLAAALCGLLLNNHERAAEVAERLGLNGHRARLFQDSAELMHSMPRLLDPTVPHSEHHRELVYRNPLSVWAADVALNDGNIDLSRVHYYMERLGRYGPDYRFGQNRIRVGLDIDAIVALGADRDRARDLLMQVVNAKLDMELGDDPAAERKFVTDLLEAGGVPVATG